MARLNDESWLDHIGRGVWFALGFTPVFVIVSGLMSFIFWKLTLDVMSDPQFQREVAAQIENSLPVQELKRHLPPAPVAEIHDSNRTPQQEQERACSLAMLRYSESQSAEDKQQMYKVCP